MPSRADIDAQKGILENRGATDLAAPSPASEGQVQASEEQVQVSEGQVKVSKMPWEDGYESEESVEE